MDEPSCLVGSMCCKCVHGFSLTEGKNCKENYLLFSVFWKVFNGVNLELSGGGDMIFLSDEGGSPP